MRMREGAMFGCARALCCAAIYGYGSAEPYSSGIARLRLALRWISAAISTRTKLEPAFGFGSVYAIKSITYRGLARAR